jgi:serine/threonine protein phosphatase PrpC
MSLTIEVAAGTDVGCLRANNEDNFGYDRRHGIYVVCDGMGGQAAGEIASRIAVNTVLEHFDRPRESSSCAGSGKELEGISERAKALACAIQIANRAIHEAAAADNSHAGMGSTISAVLVEEKNYSIAHVGDSRIYLLRPGVSSIHQLTNDHSLVMEQVRHGLMTVEEAQQSEMQNIILRALGSEETVEPDLDDLEAEEGDVLLLATDGLTRHMSDNEILGIVKGAPTLQQACDELIRAAKDRGGQDNITSLLLRFTERAWFRELFSTSGSDRITAQSN